MAGFLRLELIRKPYSPSRTLAENSPYAAARGKKSVNRQILDELKQHVPLLEYLQAHAWQPVLSGNSSANVFNHLGDRYL
jgi:hypothetical protein